MIAVEVQKVKMMTSDACGTGPSGGFFGDGSHRHTESRSLIRVGQEGGITRETGVRPQLSRARTHPYRRGGQDVPEVPGAESCDFAKCITPTFKLIAHELKTSRSPLLPLRAAIPNERAPGCHVGNYLK